MRCINAVDGINVDVQFSWKFVQLIFYNKVYQIYKLCSVHPVVKDINYN